MKLYMSDIKRLQTVVLSLVTLALILVGQSCRETTFTTDPEDMLGFSTDTLQFDTVFTTVGSATRDFRVLNPHNESIRISDISLAGGESSLFRMNVDGIPGITHEDIEVLPNDSVWIFVEVTIDPVAGNLPMVVEDSIIFFTNGVRQSVLLVAWGQNAIFISGQRVCDETWTDELPYVIYNYAQIDSNCTLTMEEGVDVHFHANSGLIIDGTLIVNGETDSVVTFQGDRLEPVFSDKPGQWDGLFFLRSSSGNSLNNLVIKNAIQGIVSGFTKESENSVGDIVTGQVPEIHMYNVQIYDITGNGILSLRSEISGENVLIYNIGESNLALLLGGDYDFTHSTFANFGSFFLSHQSPILVLSNLFNFGQDELGQDIIGVAGLETANFTNCIVEGSILEGKEFARADIEEEGIAFNDSFTNCILRTDIDTAEFDDTNCQINANVFFIDRSGRNYGLTEGSAGIDEAIGTSVTFDLNGNMRPFAGTDPDIGAIESGYEEP